MSIVQVKDGICFREIIHCVQEKILRKSKSFLCLGHPVPSKL